MATRGTAVLPAVITGRILSTTMRAIANAAPRAALLQPGDVVVEEVDNSEHGFFVNLAIAPSILTLTSQTRLEGMVRAIIVASNNNLDSPTQPSEQIMSALEALDIRNAGECYGDLFSLVGRDNLVDNAYTELMMSLDIPFTHHHDFLSPGKEFVWIRPSPGVFTSCSEDFLEKFLQPKINLTPGN